MNLSYYAFSPAIDPLSGLEDRLFSSFRQVEPDPQFVYRLRTRLMSPSEVVLEERRGTLAFLVVMLSLFSSVFLIWLLRRILK